MLSLENAFYLYAGIGISENTSLLSPYISVFLVGSKPKLTDLTITHLAIILIMILFTMGCLSRDIWGHGISKAASNVEWLSSLTRYWGNSLFVTTCLLSVLQAITISPSSSRLAQFKLKSPNPILCLFLFLWVLNISTCSNLFLCTMATPNETQASLLFLTEHYSFLPLN